MSVILASIKILECPVQGVFYAPGGHSTAQVWQSLKGVKCSDWAQIARFDEELAPRKDLGKKTPLTDLIFLLFNQSGQKWPVLGTWL